LVICRKRSKLEIQPDRLDRGCASPQARLDIAFTHLPALVSLLAIARLGTVYRDRREDCMGPLITRRRLVIGGTSAAALAAGFTLPAGAQETVTVDQFRALSARLTGAAESNLDATLAGKLLDGFVSMGRGPGLALLVADPGVSTGTLADDIVAAWYSGSYATPAGPAVAGFTDALLWNTLDFTKPPGFCGGETGYWADPPS
jgi:hypothetical protein